MTLRSRIDNLEKRTVEHFGSAEYLPRMPCAGDWWIWLEHGSDPAKSRYSPEQFQLASACIKRYIAATPDEPNQLDPDLLEEIMSSSSQRDRKDTSPSTQTFKKEPPHD